MSEIGKSHLVRLRLSRLRARPPLFMPVKWDCFASLPFSLSLSLSPYHSLFLLIPLSYSLSLSFSHYAPLFLIITLSFSLSLSLSPYYSLYPTPFLSNIFFLITNLSRFPQTFIFILSVSFSSPPVSLHSPALCTPLLPCSLF